MTSDLALVTCVHHALTAHPVARPGGSAPREAEGEPP